MILGYRKGLTHWQRVRGLITLGGEEIYPILCFALVWSPEILRAKDQRSDELEPRPRYHLAVQVPSHRAVLVNWETIEWLARGPEDFALCPGYQTVNEVLAAGAMFASDDRAIPTDRLLSV